MYNSKNESELLHQLKDFRHNALNIMQGINGYIELEDWEGLKKYFYEMLESIKPIDTNQSTFEKIENLVLKGLLSGKLKDAINRGVDFKIRTDQSTISDNDLISEIDLFRFIGTSLDKAIDAASEANIKKVSVYFLRNDLSTTIIIENTFKEKLNSLIKDELSSTLSKDPGILYNAFVQHQVFVQELQLRCSK